MLTSDLDSLCFYARVECVALKAAFAMMTKKNAFAMLQSPCKDKRDNADFEVAIRDLQREIKALQTTTLLSSQEVGHLSTW